MDQYADVEARVRASFVQGVIFDFDGTLVTLPVDWDSLKRRIRHDFKTPHGVTSLSAMLTWIQTHKSVEAYADAMALVEQAEAAGVPEAVFHTPLFDIARLCHTQDKPCGIVTTNMRSTVDAALRHISNASVFAPIVAKEDVNVPKPDPEGLLKVLHTWSMQPEACVYIGDRDIDKTAGARANIPTIIISHNV